MSAHRPISTRAMRWSSAEFVESRVLPVLMAFGLGVVLAQWADQHRLVERLAEANKQTRAAVREARHQAKVAELYAIACGPLLSLPLESTPELIAAAPAEADAASTGAAR